MTGDITSMPPGFELHFREETGSTNDDARDFARAGAADFSVAWAARQRAGRGRLGRAWQSVSGNLHGSVVLHWLPRHPAPQTLSLVTALATARALSRLLPDRHEPQVKWVNDVLVDDAKISGSLHEGGASEGWVIAGVGINVGMAPPVGEARYRSTCLADLVPDPPAPVTVLAVLLRELRDAVTAWRRDGLDGTFRADYHRRMWRLNEQLEVALDRDRSQMARGINRGITEGGHLRLEQADGTVREIPAGDVL